MNLQSCNDPWTDPADSPTFRRRLCWVCTRKLSETLDPWPFDRSSSPNSVLVTTTSSIPPCLSLSCIQILRRLWPDSPDFRVICPPSRDNIQRMADQIEITVSLSSDSWESDLEEFETNPATKNIAIPIIFVSSYYPRTTLCSDFVAWHHFPSMGGRARWRRIFGLD